MHVSQARIEANRRNAKLSSGPKTPEGKARSRANALKHGLCASTCVPESLELVQQRSAEWYGSLRPQDEGQAWLVDHVAILSIRIDRAERIERRVRDKIALKSALGWDDDRKLDVERLGADLRARPGQVVAALRRTPHGCDWLIARWAMLAHVADVKQAWTPDQIRLAHDLLATPTEFRQADRIGAELDDEGRAAGPVDDLAAMARRQIADLKARREDAAELDEADRALTEADLVDGEDPELKRLRRYEATLHRQLRWSLAQLRLPALHRSPGRDVRPRWVAQPEPEPESPEVAAIRSKSPHPPFDLEPDEYPAPGQEADIPAILASRQEKKRAKAESRRDARRRKLERLRA